MKLADALPVLATVPYVPLGTLFCNLPIDLRRNKGRLGWLLTQYVGLKHCSDRCDFEDGELKTNKSSVDGSPRETMAIMTIGGIVDTLVADRATPFADSEVYRKIRNLVYLPVVKDSPDPAEWFLLPPVHITATPGSNLYRKLDEDYRTICNQLRKQLQAPSGRIHTANGEFYLQVRSKDSRPYRPMHVGSPGRLISDKQYAFYFMKRFMLDAAKGAFADVGTTA